MHTKTLATLIAACALSACGAADPDESRSTNNASVPDDTTSTTTATTGGNNTTGSNNATTNPTTGDTVVDPPTGDEFDGVYDLLIAEGGCSAGYCHGAAVGTADKMYAFLVDRPGDFPTTCATSILVTPGDPDASVLWLRLRPASMDDGEPCAVKMPGGTEGLSEESATIVYEWILAGAPR